MTDLVLAVMKNVNWHDVDCFALSLSRCGFDGKKVLLADGITQEARSGLQTFGFDVIDSPVTGEFSGLHFQTARYAIGASYLETCWHKFEHVMWTDAWDVVFQSDPFEWIEEWADSAQLVAAREGWLIRDQAINDVWLKKLVLEDEYQRLRNEEVLCSGTVFGRAAPMTDLLQRMREWSHSVDGMQGIDQGMYNVLVQRVFRDFTYVPLPDAGFVCTCGPFLAPSDASTWTIEPPVFDRETGLVHNTAGKLFSVVHQYNRHHGALDPDGAWRSILERRYRVQ